MVSELRKAVLWDSQEDILGTEGSENTHRS